MNFKPKSTAPDLHSQFESLLDQVWRSENDWRMWDRLDAAVAAESLRERRRKDRDETKAA